ncbi:DNA polymerase IV [Parvularcula sp. IMCC14364]|uniref:DNA polymerase IV n=1 Tax=Parvularcula sp. IMCC14364 TaxID=3067902 RepID=UPI002741F9A7|nr:DNA polymerase IV [Parvularcula sp. IMCC14364]
MANFGNDLLTLSDRPLPGLCRECHHWLPEAGQLCPHCRSARVLRHAELATLSMAHLDCDAFFAALEKRDDPSLADKPLIIGGGRRGVVSTCCYIARTYGIRSAMPMFKALKACPHAIVIKPNGEKIREASLAIRAEMEALTPLVQPLSSDEAFMDLAGTEKLHGTPPALTLAKLASRIEDKVGITVSIGLSHNKFLAKLASDFDKPRGFFIIGKAETTSFLAKQPISLIWGVGKSFGAKLARDGFHTIGDLQQTEIRVLADRYGEHGLRLARLSRGEDHRPVNPSRETKSLSSETTFNDDIRAYQELEDILWQLSEKISARMKEKGFTGRVITLKLKTADFRSMTRRKTLEYPTNLARVAFDTGRALLRDVIPGDMSREAYRLIGIGFSDIEVAGETGQSYLFMDDLNKLSAREKAVDSLREKFGDRAIGTGRNLRRRK